MLNLRHTMMITENRWLSGGYAGNTILNIMEKSHTKMRDPRIARLTNEMKNQVYIQTFECLANGDEYGLQEIWDEFSLDERVVLWAMFESWERKAMKKYGL